MRRATLLLCTLMVCGVLAGGPPAAVTAAQPNTPAADRQSLRQNDAMRSYIVRVPDAVAQRRDRVPLVLVLHGGGGNALNAETMTGFTEKARQEGFIVAYPEGTSRGALGLLTWNAGHCCGFAMQSKVDDVGFIGALIDQLVKDQPVDDRRIYVTGMSNGGMMTHRLGIELSDRLAAIAPVVATLFGDEARPKRALPALMFNGMLDKSVPAAGGAPGGRFTGAWDGTPAKPALDQAAFWARANGCTGDPEKTETATAVIFRLRCGGGPPVALYLVKDNGHAWPGGKAGSARGDTPTPALDATGLMWEFFKAHTR